MEKSCKECNIIFKANRKDKCFCSIVCKNSYGSKLWRANNPILVKQNNDKNRIINKNKLQEQSKKWRENNEEKIKKDKKKWQQDFKDQHGISHSTFRRRNDINERLKHNVRVRINKAIKNINKSGSAVKELGCSIEEFKKYIEQQFQPGMNWDNYGKYEKHILTWNIDHIKPLDCFDLSKPEEFKNACHFSNLRPFWSKDNLIKGSKNPFDV